MTLHSLCSYNSQRLNPRDTYGYSPMKVEYNREAKVPLGACP